MYNKSRGATIFTDKEGSIRIPSDVILELMEFRDLEELYHRYSPSIRIYFSFFSSPGRSPGRAIILPPASALALASALAKY